MVVYLASAGARDITGETFIVNGGEYSAQRQQPKGIDFRTALDRRYKTHKKWRAREGFEPPTPSLGSSAPIQLSYGHIREIIYLPSRRLKKNRFVRQIVPQTENRVRIPL